MSKAAPDLERRAGPDQDPQSRRSSRRPRNAGRWGLAAPRHRASAIRCHPVPAPGSPLGSRRPPWRRTSPGTRCTSGRAARARGRTSRNSLTERVMSAEQVREPKLAPVLVGEAVVARLAARWQCATQRGNALDVPTELDFLGQEHRARLAVFEAVAWVWSARPEEARRSSRAWTSRPRPTTRSARAADAQTGGDGGASKFSTRQACGRRSAKE